MNTPSLSTFVRSKLFAGIITGIGIMLILIVVFEAGYAIGFHAAMFSSRWGQNYSQNFGGPTSGFPGTHSDPTPDGTFGKILSISSSTVVIASTHNPEQRIILDSDTIIRNRTNTISSSQLTVGETVVVLGDPNEQGEIEAKLIRVVPSTPDTASTTAPAP